MTDQVDKELLLSKHQGLGNDFLVLLDMTGTVDLDQSEIVALLDRHLGVGADGLMHVTPADADSPSVARMVLYNSDGSRAEMSGNGIRCLAQALIDAGGAPLGSFSIDTDAGVMEIESHSAFGEAVAAISVGIGTPKIFESDVRTIDGIEYQAVRVDIGNPHLVLIPTQVMDAGRFNSLDLATLGPKIESQYPGGMNIEWIVPDRNRSEMMLRVWERGAGITQACGTGSTASSFVANDLGLVDDTVVVHNPGGDLTVRIAGGTCYLTGPAQKVCEIQVTSSQLKAMAALVK
ncbi:MAG: diaminopimelate epimerase [Actinomycetota bacterium]|nr:MAG: diaminopimelate epimerase [Actinomycetota bacterium]